MGGDNMSDGYVTMSDIAKKTGISRKVCMERWHAICSQYELNEKLFLKPMTQVNQIGLFKPHDGIGNTEELLMMLIQEWGNKPFASTVNQINDEEYPELIDRHSSKQGEPKELEKYYNFLEGLLKHVDHMHDEKVFHYIQSSDAYRRAYFDIKSKPLIRKKFEQVLVAANDLSGDRLKDLDLIISDQLDKLLVAVYGLKQEQQANPKRTLDDFKSKRSAESLDTEIATALNYSVNLDYMRRIDAIKNSDSEDNAYLVNILVKKMSEPEMNRLTSAKEINFIWKRYEPEIETGLEINADDYKRESRQSASDIPSTLDLVKWLLAPTTIKNDNLYLDGFNDFDKLIDKNNGLRSENTNDWFAKNEEVVRRCYQEMLDFIDTLPKDSEVREDAREIQLRFVNLLRNLLGINRQPEFVYGDSLIHLLELSGMQPYKLYPVNVDIDGRQPRIITEYLQSIYQSIDAFLQIGHLNWVQEIQVGIKGALKVILIFFDQLSKGKLLKIREGRTASLQAYVQQRKMWSATVNSKIPDYMVKSLNDVEISGIAIDRHKN